MEDTIDEPRKILLEYLNIEFSLKKPPKRKSNKSFKGYIFVKILSKFLRKHTPKSYTLVLGPLWIKGLEWIEWDLAIIKKDANPEYDVLYNPEDIIALFECKVSGIYGGKNELKKIINRIKNNFEKAKKICNNLKKCFYISLMEVKPKKTGINYYRETKKNIENSFILFNSRSIEYLSKSCRNPLEIAIKAEEFKNEWKNLIESLLKL